eukprot:599955-Rhodomonas_salina.5
MLWIAQAGRSIFYSILGNNGWCSAAKFKLGLGIRRNPLASSDSSADGRSSSRARPQAGPGFQVCSLPYAVPGYTCTCTKLCIVATDINRLCWTWYPGTRVYRGKFNGYPGLR